MSGRRGKRDYWLLLLFAVRAVRDEDEVNASYWWEYVFLYGQREASMAWKVDAHSSVVRPTLV